MVDSLSGNGSNIAKGCRVKANWINANYNLWSLGKQKVHRTQSHLYCHFYMLWNILLFPEKLIQLSSYGIYPIWVPPALLNVHYSKLTSQLVRFLVISPTHPVLFVFNPRGFVLFSKFWEKMANWETTVIKCWKDYWMLIKMFIFMQKSHCRNYIVCSPSVSQPWDEGWIQLQ